MKILLLKPKWFVKNGVYKVLNRVKFTPLNLGIIAALSDGHEVKVIDGDWDEIPYNETFDLVGITVATFTSYDAYKITKKFKEKGTKVILGGPHPSLLPDECLQYADSVVIGEVEYLWKDILKDMEKRSLKKIYKSDRVVDMNDVPFPERKLLNEQKWFACVQTTRGCPNTCKYCYLPYVPWKIYRKRAPGLVYKEIESIKQKIIYFVDDNLFADENYAMKLFDTIAPLKKSWSVQSPTSIAENEQILEKMALSGCFVVQMGFQTINQESLKWASINQNRVEKYRETVRKLHKYNILVTGFFIFGFDTDTKEIFKRTEEAVSQLPNIF